jgi:4-hydroxy-tetrahydrodipicolinate reductase
MKLGMIGYGKMGQAIEAIALERGHSISFKMDVKNPEGFDPGRIPMADVVLEFTNPEAAVDNIKAVIRSGMPVVSGTTGWLDRYQEVVEYCKQYHGGLFYATNFSPGVNLFFAMNKQLARIMAPHPEYHARIEEIHHSNKKDAPSGTALALVQGILAENQNLKGWSADLLPPADQVQVTSIREGAVTGIHEVRYFSGDDLITLRHEAFSRRSLAFGAVLAAEFMHKKTGIYSMSDLLDID